MRLHRIGVQAFGPFADRVEVDVDALAEHGLFLLHGPTGAGKTSLLDAVCFALYGVVPGARSSLRHTTLRSDHAAPGVAPLVQVELTVGQRRIEVRRSPAWQRPKARGTGTTTEQASVRVRELVGDRWEPLASRLDEAGHLLSSLLGMDAQQFTTVVLLPQGDFATFLRAGPDDRRAVLERLFGTDRFAAVETWLADRRTETGRALREARTHRDQLLARVDERAGALRESCPEQVDAAAPDAAGARHLYELAISRLDAAREALTQQQGLLTVARAGAEGAAAARRRDHELVDLLTRRQRLEDRSEQVRSLRGALARHAAARGVAPFGERCEQAGAELDDATSALDTALARLPSARRSRDPRVLTERAASLGGELAVLASLLEPEEEVVRGRAALAEATTSLASLDAEHATALAEEGGLLEAERVLSRARDEADRVASGGAAAGADLERALVVQEAADTAARLAPVVRAADHDARTAGDAASAARAHHLDLVERRLAGMAAELAASLQQDGPCPVCGAVEHPAPAVGTGRLGADEVAEALRTASRLASAADSAREYRDGLVRELAAADVVAAGTTVDRAEHVVAQARTAVVTCESAARTLLETDARRADLAADRARCLATLADVDERRARVRDSLAELRTRVADTEVRLAEVRGTDESVRARHARLTAGLAALTEAAASAREVPGARRALTSAQRRAEKAATAAGFGSLDDALAALLPAAEQRRAEGVVAAHDRDLAGVEQRLAHPDLAEAAVADLVVARAALESQEALVRSTRTAAEEAEGRVRRVAADVTVLESTAVALHGLAEELTRHDADTSVAEEQAAVLEELAACTLGTSASNVLRMRLSAYVVAARLEQVAAAASVRLLATSAGRYELRHCDARGGGGGRSGLGLSVLDHWTGQERATATLSGGETFLASLALALGLADVVQAESGGLAIETLFVDEGFGSLDDDTLEQVMAGLDELREGGRAVGLVSHLPELRSRIPSQLHVVRGERGSTVRLRRMAG